MTTLSAARTYNQVHVPRRFARGKRRISIYWTWSYGWESNRELMQLDNRFATMTEFRRAAWPAYEGWQWSDAAFLQGIAGTLELLHRSAQQFQAVAGEATGQPVAVFQRIDQAGYRQPLDERVLADADTLLVFGMDHLACGDEASTGEIAAIKEWLEREGTCLVLAPHHDVGFSDDPEMRQQEYLHHGDPVVPRQQRFSCYTRSLMKTLGIPVVNRWGLRPAVLPGARTPMPLTADRDIDQLGLLNGVTSLNFHPHLPHYEVLDPGNSLIKVLGRQPVDTTRPHPFVTAGNTEFNALLWITPNGQRAGDVVMVDVAHFTTLSGRTPSLETFWRNVAAMQ
jgi:hypothetical protein